MLGYLEGSAGHRRRSRDGWVFLRNIVRCDAEGFYYVLDRSKEMIVQRFRSRPRKSRRSCSNIPPCAIRVSPSPTPLPEKSLAFVVLAGGVHASDTLDNNLRDFVATGSLITRKPREIHFVEVRPTTPSGKILRRNCGDFRVIGGATVSKC